ncbi:MAG TPA: bifunctional DNA primase/polymerase [Roseiflexaceae bacterium]|nr:bifunctional DNA primase/polymerase [Roseiflexaceae bacterium]
MTTMLEAARAYVAAGLSVIPIQPGTKLPAIYTYTNERWESRVGNPVPARAYTQRMPTDDELCDWFGGERSQMGIVCGPVSGGLCVLDLEHGHLRGMLRDQLGWQFLDRLPVVKTGRGHHIYFRMDDPPGHQRLAEVPRRLFAELMATDCYVVAPPSYELVQGDLTQIPRLSADEAAMLIQAARFEGMFRSRADGDFQIVIDQMLRLELPHMGEALRLPWGAVRHLVDYIECYGGLLRAAADGVLAPQPSSFENGDEYPDDDPDADLASDYE